MSTLFRVFLLRLLFAGACAGLTLAPLRAEAEGKSPTYLWGIIKSGCKADADLTSAVEVRLLKMGERIQRLRPNPEADAGGCADKECAGRLRLACPQLTGMLLGGHVEERKVRRAGSAAESEPAEETWLRALLWRVDLATSQTVRRSYVCNGCDPADLVARHAAELLEDKAAAGEELTCPGVGLDSGVDAEPGVETERLGLVISSATNEQRGVQRAVTELLKRHIRLTGRDLVVEDSRHGQPLALLRKHRRGQAVLEVTLKPDGEAQVQLWEQTTSEPVGAKVECFGCSDEDLAHRITVVAGELLDRCSAEGCRSGAQSVMLRRPVLLCGPLSPPANCEAPPPATTRGSEPPTLPLPPQPDFLASPCGRAVAIPEPGVLPDLTLTKRTDAGIDKKRQGMRTAGKALLGIGAVGLAAMGVLLISNKQPGAGLCRDENGRASEQGCLIFIEHAVPLAVTAGTTGGGLMLAGGILLGLANRSSQPSVK